MYDKVLLAYDGSIEGRRALREGARIAQYCRAEVFLLAVVEVSAGTGTLEGGFVIPITEQIEIYQKILGEGVERLKAMGFSPTARLGMEKPDARSPASPKRSGQTCVIGHRRATDRWRGGSARCGTKISAGVGRFRRFRRSHGTFPRG